MFLCLSDNIPATIPVGEECIITVNAAEAGHGNITCRIRSNSGTDIDIDIVDNGDGTVSLLYTPRIPDAYTINIKFGGQPVPKGKFTQQVCYHFFVLLCNMTRDCLLLTSSGVWEGMFAHTNKKW